MIFLLTILYVLLGIIVGYCIAKIIGIDMEYSSEDEYSLLVWGSLLWPLTLVVFGIYLLCKKLLFPLLDSILDKIKDNKS